MGNFQRPSWGQGGQASGMAWSQIRLQFSEILSAFLTSWLWLCPQSFYHGPKVTISTTQGCNFLHQQWRSRVVFTFQWPKLAWACPYLSAEISLPASVHLWKPSLWSKVSTYPLRSERLFLNSNTQHILPSCAFFTQLTDPSCRSDWTFVPSHKILSKVPDTQMFSILAKWNKMNEQVNKQTKESEPRSRL